MAKIKTCNVDSFSCSSCGVLQWLFKSDAVRPKILGGRSNGHSCKQNMLLKSTYKETIDKLSKNKKKHMISLR